MNELLHLYLFISRDPFPPGASDFKAVDKLCASAIAVKVSVWLKKIDFPQQWSMAPEFYHDGIGSTQKILDNISKSSRRPHISCNVCIKREREKPTSE